MRVIEANALNHVAHVSIYFDNKGIAEYLDVCENIDKIDLFILATRHELVYLPVPEEDDDALYEQYIESITFEETSDEESWV